MPLTEDTDGVEDRDPVDRLTSDILQHFLLLLDAITANAVTERRGDGYLDLANWQGWGYLMYDFDAKSHDLHFFAQQPKYSLLEQWRTSSSEESSAADPSGPSPSPPDGENNWLRAVKKSLRREQENTEFQQEESAVVLQPGTTGTTSAFFLPSAADLQLLVAAPPGVQQHTAPPAAPTLAEKILPSFLLLLVTNQRKPADSTNYSFQQRRKINTGSSSGTDQKISADAVVAKLVQNVVARQGGGREDDSNTSTSSAEADFSNVANTTTSGSRGSNSIWPSRTMSFACPVMSLLSCFLALVLLRAECSSEARRDEEEFYAAAKTGRKRNRRGANTFSTSWSARRLRSSSSVFDSEFEESEEDEGTTTSDIDEDDIIKNRHLGGLSPHRGDEEYADVRKNDSRKNSHLSLSATKLRRLSHSSAGGYKNRSSTPHLRIPCRKQPYRPSLTNELSSPRARNLQNVEKRIRGKLFNKQHHRDMFVIKKKDVRRISELEVLVKENEHLLPPEDLQNYVIDEFGSAELCYLRLALQSPDAKVSVLFEQLRVLVSHRKENPIRSWCRLGLKQGSQLGPVEDLEGNYDRDDDPEDPKTLSTSEGIDLQKFFDWDRRTEHLVSTTFSCSSSSASDGCTSSQQNHFVPASAADREQITNMIDGESADLRISDTEEPMPNFPPGPAVTSSPVVVDDRSDHAAIKRKSDDRLAVHQQELHPEKAVATLKILLQDKWTPTIGLQPFVRAGVWIADDGIPIEAWDTRFLRSSECLRKFKIDDIQEAAKLWFACRNEQLRKLKAPAPYVIFNLKGLRFWAVLAQQLSHKKIAEMGLQLQPFWPHSHLKAIFAETPDWVRTSWTWVGKYIVQPVEGTVEMTDLTVYEIFDRLCSDPSERSRFRREFDAHYGPAV
ncbi:unnamed protein product [Amoebophrya sp. A120]|nr:unnamed protein product [Amoebophrya sp. A120]|eukprot:GSA120T00023235001.1